MLRDWARMRCGRSVVEKHPAMLIEFTVGDRLLLPFATIPNLLIRCEMYIFLGSSHAPSKAKT